MNPTTVENLRQIVLFRLDEDELIPIGRENLKQLKQLIEEHAKLIEAADELHCETVALVEAIEEVPYAGHQFGTDQTRKSLGQLYPLINELENNESICSDKSFTDEKQTQPTPHNMTASQGIPVYALDWCPDCDRNTPHLRISQYAIECKECGEIKERNQ